MADASAILITYDRPALFRLALRSALAQRGVDLDVVVVDNGSDPPVAELVAECADPRVRLLRHDENIGATPARNHGIAQAAAPWVGFLDDDDLWAPTKVASQLAAAQAAGADWVYVGCVYTDATGAVVAGAPPPPVEVVATTLPVRFSVPAGLSGVLWRPAALPDGGLLDERLSFADDWDLCLRLLRVGAPAAVLEPLVAFRQHGGSMSRTSAAYRGEYAIIADKHADLRRERRLLDDVRLGRFAGSEALRAGARGEAIAAYWRSARAGDVGSLARLPAALLPRRAQGGLRRWLRSDRRWMAEARRWLDGVTDSQVG